MTNNGPLGTSSFGTAPAAETTQTTRTGANASPRQNQQQTTPVSGRRIGSRTGRNTLYGNDNKLANLLRERWTQHAEKGDIQYPDYDVNMAIVRSDRNKEELTFPVAVFIAQSKANPAHIAHHAVVLSDVYKEHTEERDRLQSITRPAFGFELYTHNSDSIPEAALATLGIRGRSLGGTSSHTSHNFDHSDESALSNLISNSSDAAVDALMNNAYGPLHEAGVPDRENFKAIVSWNKPGHNFIDPNGFTIREDGKVTFVNKKGSGRQEAVVSFYVDLRLTEAGLNEDNPTATYDPVIVITNVSSSRDRADSETLFWIVTAYEALVLRSRGYMHRMMTLGDPERDPGHLNRLVNILAFINDDRRYNPYKDSMNGTYENLRDPMYDSVTLKEYFEKCLHADNIPLVVDINYHAGNQWMFDTILKSYIGNKEEKKAAYDSIYASLNIFTGNEFPVDYKGDIFSGYEANFRYSAGFQRGNTLVDTRWVDTLSIMNTFQSMPSKDLVDVLSEYAKASEEPTDQKETDTAHTCALRLYNAQAEVLGASRFSPQDQNFDRSMLPDGFIVSFTMDPEFIEKVLKSFEQVYGMEFSVPQQSIDGARRRAERSRGVNATRLGRHDSGRRSERGSRR